jgi:hypothetical protein
MMQPIFKSSQSPQRAWLIELMQDLDFGKIEGFALRDSEPVFDPPPRIIRDVKFGTQNGPRPEASLDDFALKGEVLELFSQFEAIDNAIIHSLEVKHGLPFRIHWEVAA